VSLKISKGERLKKRL